MFNIFFFYVFKNNINYIIIILGEWVYMKKYRILLFLVGLFLFLPITKVKAYDEYTLKIVDDTTIEVYDQNMNLRSGDFGGTVYSWNQITKMIHLLII